MHKRSWIHSKELKKWLPSCSQPMGSSAARLADGPQDALGVCSMPVAAPQYLVIWGFSKLSPKHQVASWVCFGFSFRWLKRKVS